MNRLTANVDALHNGQAFGPVAQRLIRGGMDINILRPWLEDDPNRPDHNMPFTTKMVGNQAKRAPAGNATLRKDEWKYIDEAVLKAARERLVGIADLERYGLVKDIGNGLATTVFQWETIKDFLTASVSMDGVTRGNGDRPNFEVNYMPLPIIHADWQINSRALTVSRNGNTPLDTTTAEMAARVVADKLEDMLFTDTTYTFGGGTIYSYINATNRNTVSLSENWDASGKTGIEIVNDVLSMKQASINDRHYGPWILYIPTAYETVLDDNYVSNYPETVRERILKISGIQEVKVVDTLTANNVLMVELSTDTVRLIKGLAVTPVEWTTEGGLVLNYKIMTIQIPQIRSDQNSRSGIVHLS